MKLQKTIINSVLVLFGSSLIGNLWGNPSITKAAVFSNSETIQIKQYQDIYKNLDASVYDNGNLYNVAPLFDYPFNPGILKNSYRTTSLAWINYYRRLVGLQPVKTTTQANYNSQIAASSMAAAKSDPHLSQHGLYNSVKPDYLPQSLWNIASNSTVTGNLYFRSSPETAGYPISSLIIDNTNIEGQNTGHRAWLLSSRLSTVGIGASYNQQTKYENIQVVNNEDANQPAQKSIVSYPSSGVFPIEEMQDYSSSWNLVVPWSIYFSDQQNPFTKNTTVSITNKDSGTTYNAFNVKKYLPDSGMKYTLGNFTGVLTFLPSEKMPITNNTEYQVTVEGLNKQVIANGQYSYTFKTFSQQSNQLRPYIADNAIEVPQKEKVRIVSNHDIAVFNSPTTEQKKTGITLKNNELVTSNGMNYQQGRNWFNIGKNRWIDGKYVENFVDNHSGNLTITTNPNQPLSVWSSPYADHKRTSRRVNNGSTWFYNKKVRVANNSWYRISKNGWIEGKFVNN